MMLAQENQVSEDAEEFSVFTITPAFWKMVTSALQTLCEDSTFDLDADGLRTRAMDQSHVALLDVKFPRSSFDKFHCSKPSRFTVHLDDFSKIVKRSDLRENFQISKGQNRNLSIKIGSGHYRKEFELHLIEDELKSSPLPKLAFTTRFTMDVQSFFQILSDISVISSHLSVSVSKSGSLNLSGKGDSGNVEIALGKTESTLLHEVIVESEAPETKAVYNLEYLLKIVKAVSSFSDFVRFEFSSKMPLRIEFSSSQSKSSSSIQFYLAPKMID
jgi:proliferating cell nuclear antigen